MEIDYKALQEYNDLIKDVDNLRKILDEVESTIIDDFKKSPESAIEAHYEFKALEKIRGKINSIINKGLQAQDNQNGFQNPNQY